MNGSLKGVRVVDLTHGVAGPACAQMLADLGAEVVKIENPRGGDFLRSVARFGFQAFNGGKRSVALDLKTPDGREAVRRLVADADVLVHSQRSDVMAETGFTYDALRADNPALIHVGLSGFGTTGPDAGRRGVDALIQVESGLAYLQGRVLGNISIIDQAAGFALTFATLAALADRDRTGAGRAIEISLLDVAVSLQSAAIARHTGGGGDAVAANAVPVFAAADGRVLVLLDDDRAWTAFCTVLDRPDLVAATPFATAADRQRHVEELADAIGPGFGARTAGDWVARLRDGGVSATVVRDYPALLPLWTSGDVGGVLSIGAGPMAAPQPAYRVGANARRGGSGAPQIGEHTDAVLRELAAR